MPSSRRSQAVPRPRRSGPKRPLLPPDAPSRSPGKWPGIASSGQPREARSSVHAAHADGVLNMRVVAGDVRRRRSTRPASARTDDPELGVHRARAEPSSPWRKSPLHSSGDASRLTALFGGYICPICALLTPCQTGASPLSVPRGVPPRAARGERRAAHSREPRPTGHAPILRLRPPTARPSQRSRPPMCPSLIFDMAWLTIDIYSLQKCYRTKILSVNALQS